MHTRVYVCIFTCCTAAAVGTTSFPWMGTVIHLAVTCCGGHIVDSSRYSFQYFIHLFRLVVIWMLFLLFSQ